MRVCVECVCVCVCVCVCMCVYVCVRTYLSNPFLYSTQHYILINNLLPRIQELNYTKINFMQCV